MTIRTIRRLVSATVIAVGAAMLTASAAADVPATITHQGRLFDTASKPVSTTLDVVFTIYESEASDAKVLWTETHSITFEDGYFSVALGSIKPFESSVFDGSTR
jgi:hypothetical protein